MTGPRAARRGLGLAGVALAVASVPLGYLRLGGRPVTLTLPAGTVGLDALVAVAVLGSAGVALLDCTRGEQLLGAVAGGLAAAVGVSWVVGAAVSAGPGLPVAMVAWALVEVADLLDPRLAHPATPRRLAVAAVGLAAASTVAFLTVGGPVRLLSGVLAVAAWLYAVRWELGAVRR